VSKFKSIFTSIEEGDRFGDSYDEDGVCQLCAISSDSDSSITEKYYDNDDPFVIWIKRLIRHTFCVHQYFLPPQQKETSSWKSCQDTGQLRYAK